MRHVRTAAVVGGGIGGLATAIALRQHGIEATVYERAPASGEVGAGISLWPNATRALRALGALDPLLDTAGHIAALSVRDARGRVLLRAPVQGHDAPALCAYRPDLVAALHSALPAGSSCYGKALAAIEADGTRARLQFEDGTGAEADIVVGADGLRSTVRTYVTADAVGPVYRGYSVWRGIGPLPPSFERGEISESWGDGLRFGLLDTGGGRAYWYATAPWPEGEPDGGAESRKAAVLDLFADWHAPVPEVVRATPAARVLQGGTYDRRPRRGWSRGRAVLVGDAAHPTTPNLGQGGGMAIEDSLVLARCLSVAPPAEAFRMYERERYRRTARVTVESLWTGRLGLARGAAARLRDVVTRATPDALYVRRLGWLFRYAA